jgi:hypothetical protein
MGYALSAYALVLSCLLFYGLHLGAERARLAGRRTLVYRFAAFSLAGLLLGGAIGILSRPTPPGSGPVSLDAVFSRERGAAGTPQSPDARRALHWIAAASLIGAAAGGGGALLRTGRGPRRPAT